MSERPRSMTWEQMLAPLVAIVAWFFFIAPIAAPVILGVVIFVGGFLVLVTGDAL